MSRGRKSSVLQPEAEGGLGGELPMISLRPPAATQHHRRLSYMPAISGARGC
jgi:hypothetical protein